MNKGDILIQNAFKNRTNTHAGTYSLVFNKGCDIAQSCLRAIFFIPTLLLKKQDPSISPQLQANHYLVKCTLFCEQYKHPHAHFE